MQQAKLPEIIDSKLKRHGLQQGISWGWIGTIWLAHIMTQGDHRKEHVQTWARQAQESIKKITGHVELDEMDFTDDRLSILLKKLSAVDIWAEIEQDLGRNLLKVYELNGNRVRIDATTVSGYHVGGEDNLFQYGHSKDDDALKQVKIAMATLDPLGLPLVSQVVAGNKADDPLYVPIVQRVLSLIKDTELLFVGDCKMGALATRSYIQSVGQHYLCPLALTGEVGEKLGSWVESQQNNEIQAEGVYIKDGDGALKRLAEGYQFERKVSRSVGNSNSTWREQVFLVRSESYRTVKLANLETRLTAAGERLLALTPEVGRGKRQIKDEAALKAAAMEILARYEVSGLLDWQFERQEAVVFKYVGRGRGSKDREQTETVKVRYVVTAVSRQEAEIVKAQAILGWRVYVTNAADGQISLQDAVLTYRNEWLIERGFQRLKGATLSISPLYVKRDDQVRGLTHLLTIAVRFLNLIEFVVRRKLKQNNELLLGMIGNNPKKGINNPTAERLLKAFDEITLTIVYLPDRVIRHVTPLSALQIRILELLGLPITLYSRLGDNLV